MELWYYYALITPKKASNICLDRTRNCMESSVPNVTCLGMGIHCKYILILKTRVHLRTFNNRHLPSKQTLRHRWLSMPYTDHASLVTGAGPLTAGFAVLHKPLRLWLWCSNLTTKFVQSYVYVVIQFYPWLKFYFPLFWGIVMHGNEFGTKVKYNLHQG